MNNQTVLLLAMGAFVALIVGVAAVDQYLLDKHPTTEVEGLLWRIENALDRIRDLEATIQVTHEEYPADSLRMKFLYIKGPPATFSMRYLRPQETLEGAFSGTVRDEAYTIEGDQVLHYIPRENVLLSKRWPGLPLASVGLSVFNVSQMRSDWASGRTEIRILRPVTGFTVPEDIPPMTTLPSFAEVPDPAETAFTPPSYAADTTYSLACFTFCPEFQEDAPMFRLGLASSLDSESMEGTITRSYILEVRDALTKDLVRMVWVDRETYLVQKVVTFQGGQRRATLSVQLVILDQGLTPDDVIVRPQPGIPIIRG